MMLSRERLLGLTETLLEAQGKSLTDGEVTRLSDIGFSSLDFAEYAVRVEAETGEQYDIASAAQANIETVADMLDYFGSLAGSPAA